MPKPLPSVEELKLWFDYNAETGALIWRSLKGIDGRPNTRYVGKDAGLIQKDGYRYVWCLKQNFLAHRIIWKMVTGTDPKEEIDHKNGARADNKWLNLREASHGENNHNVPCKRHSRSGIKGVGLVKGGWVARIRKDGVQYRLGVFDNQQAAIAAHNAAAIRLYGALARVA